MRLALSLPVQLKLESVRLALPILLQLLTSGFACARYGQATREHASARQWELGMAMGSSGG
ncbi:hypothetical protein SBDP1_420003 [Syntrophobacter sp. SbD1]|nr:hypothetical protein SBDP1_420003 [Syntrophobacter sp. SbD1]